jgi:outer membrane receptor for ferrienterochelin and colicins
MRKKAFLKNSCLPVALPKTASCFVTRILSILLSGLLMVGILFSTASAEKPDLTKLTLEELMDVRIQPVISASKYKQKTLDAPSSMTVITADQIQKNGYRTLADVLQGVRGFYIRDDRNYDYVGFRGMGRPGDYSSRVLILLDGVRVNDNIYDSAPIGADFILDLDLISRIEIVRGPSYALYGNNAFFALINVITKSGGELNGGEIAGDAGSVETYNGRISYGKRFEDKSQLLFSGSLLESGGQSLYYPEFDTPDQNNGVAHGCDGEDAKSLFAKYSRDGITLSSAYVKRGKQIPTAPWGVSFNDPRTKTWDERAFLDIKLERELEAGLEMMARLTYGLYSYDGNYAYRDEASGETIINKDEQEGRWWGADFHFIRPLGNHMLIAGGEYKDNFTLDQKNFDTLGNRFLDDKRDTYNWGVFIQDEFPLLPLLKVNASLRYDHFSTFGGTLNPRFALIYRPFQDTALKYLTGRAFRAPDPFELFYNDGDVTQKANPHLREESLISHELVWEQMLGQSFSGTVTVYHYDIDALISQKTDTDGLSVFINQGQVEANGFEIEMNAFSRNGLSAGVSYAFQKSDYSNSNLLWTNSPRHLAKFNISVPLIRDALFLSLEEQYTSRLLTLSRASAGDYFLTNLTLYWKNVFRNVDFSGSIYNLFDRNYRLPATDDHVQDAIRQDGICFRVKLTCRF